MHHKLSVICQKAKNSILHVFPYAWGMLKKNVVGNPFTVNGISRSTAAVYFHQALTL
jgi:hypothetical protein